MAITQLQLSGVYGMRYGSFEGRAEFMPAVGMILIDRTYSAPGVDVGRTSSTRIAVDALTSTPAVVLVGRELHPYRGLE